METSSDQRDPKPPRLVLRVSTAVAEGTPQAIGLSLGEICIRASEFVEIGAQVVLDLEFPELKTRMTIVGRVVFANRDSPLELGIRYEGLDDSQRQLLRRFLALVVAPEDPRSSET